MILSAIIGLLLLASSLVYFLQPASSLPSFMPGYDAALVKHHYKHGIACLLLALAAFSFAWFQTGQKSPKEEKQGS